MEQSAEEIDPPSDSGTFNLGVADFQLRWVDQLLSWRIPLYSELSTDKLFLSESGQLNNWTQGSSFLTKEHEIVLTQKIQQGKVLRIVSHWQPIVIPWSSWLWWAEASILMNMFFFIVGQTLRKVFLFDLGEGKTETDGKGEADLVSEKRLFRSGTRLEKLALVQLAQEGIINPKATDILAKLIHESLVGRVNGLLRIIDDKFAQFLADAVDPKTIQEWEKDGADIRLLSLRTSLLAFGVGAAVFLIYSQGDLLNTWAKLLGGLATLIPVFLRLQDGVWGRSKSEG